MSDCVFCAVVARRAEASFVHEDDGTRRAGPGAGIVAPAARS